ncbi:MAG: porin family protein, partial [Caulobacteraceae bacterium]|nr:porin family protein [Caulobacteraceae bacterium]
MLGGVLAALLLAPQAMAQDAGWYGAFDLGYHWPEGVDAKSSDPAADGKPYSYNFKSEDSYLGFVRLGYQFTPNWRVELEGGMRGGPMESIKGNPARLTVPDQVCSTKTLATCNSPGADLTAYTVMGNVIYDFFPDSSFRPFVGAGIGANYVDVNVAGRFDSPNTGFLRIDDEDTAFAWQFLGGLAFDITDRLSGDLTYRYLDGNDISVSAQPQGKAAPDPGVFTG